MALCTDPLHPTKKNGQRKDWRNCRLCNSKRNCLDPSHPRRKNGKVRTKLACWICTPHRFCFDHHPIPRHKNVCRQCKPERFCQQHLFKAKSRLKSKCSPCKTRAWLQQVVRNLTPH